MTDWDSPPQPQPHANRPSTPAPAATPAPGTGRTGTRQGQTPAPAATPAPGTGRTGTRHGQTPAPAATPAPGTGRTGTRQGQTRHAVRLRRVSSQRGERPRLRRRGRDPAPVRGPAVVAAARPGPTACGGRLKDASRSFGPALAGRP